MMSWSQRMAEALLRPMPAANSANSADRLEVRAIGSIGTIGTGLSIGAPHPAGKQSALLALSAQCLVDAVPPCPADVAERAAIIAGGDHCHRATANTRALAEYGYPSLQALAYAHRQRILGQFAQLRPSLKALFGLDVVTEHKAHTNERCGVRRSPSRSIMRRQPR